MDVRALRERLNITQTELARKTGIPRDRIAKWEQGKGVPKAEDQRILEKVFGKNVPQNATTATEPPQNGQQSRRQVPTTRIGKAIWKLINETGMTVEQIADESKNSRQTLQRYKKEGDSQKVWNKLLSRFPDIINGTPAQPEPVNDKYVASIEDRLHDLKQDKEWLKKMVEINLNNLVFGQKSILSHVSVILEKDCEAEAAGDKRKEKRLKDDVDKRATAKMMGTQQTDSVNT